MSNKFIDISEHNTILSLNGLISSNLKGVIMKATEGETYVDHAYEIYFDALSGQIPVGFYHFLSATSEPRNQALNFWNHIKDKTFEIIPVLDVERNEKAPLENLSESYAKEFIAAFREISGQDIIIYSNRCYIEEYFSLEFRQSNKWWVADYSANDTPQILGCEVVAWQYTEDCKSYAFAMGNLDSNILVSESNFYIQQPKNYKNIEPTINILQLQIELNRQGFKDKNGDALEVDGVGGELTLSACPMLKTGTQGNITRWVQTRIGMEQPKIDGWFGESTRKTVIEFQENMSITGDGIVGQNTWNEGII